jgi:hypothetical protein
VGSVRAGCSENLDHLLATVRGIADELLTFQIDHPIHRFERKLADNDGLIVETPATSVM